MRRNLKIIIKSHSQLKPPYTIVVMEFSKQRIVHKIEEFLSPILNFRIFHINIVIIKSQRKEIRKTSYGEISVKAIPCLGQDTDTNHISCGKERQDVVYEVFRQLGDPITFNFSLNSTGSGIHNIS